MDIYIYILYHNLLWIPVCSLVSKCPRCEEGMDHAGMMQEGFFYGMCRKYENTRRDTGRDTWTGRDLLTTNSWKTCGFMGLLSWDYHGIIVNYHWIQGLMPTTGSRRISWGWQSINGTSKLTICYGSHGPFSLMVYRTQEWWCSTANC